jgi:hypothetical protein
MRVSTQEIGIPAPSTAAQDSKRFSSRIRSLLIAGLIACAGILFAHLLIRSRHWEYDHDTPLLQYCGFLMDRYGWMPYRDFFETSMPGTFLFHAGIVALFGTGNLAFILVNDALLGLLLLTSYLWMRQLSRPAAVLFVCWYGAFYLASGPGELMQRDWLAVLPIAIAFSILSNSRTSNGAARMGTAFLIGSLMGASACIKPQLALAGIPIVWGLGLVNDRAHTQPRSEAMREFVLRVALPAMLGIAAPLAAVAAWLAYRGSFASFASMVHDYLPLHIQQTGDHQFLPPAERLRYVLVNAVQLRGCWPMMLAALFGFVLIDRQFTQQPRNRTLFRLAFAMLAIYAIEPVLSGQFWEYHYDPFQYWLIAILSLLVLPVLSTSRYVAIPALTLTSCVAFSFGLHHVTKAGPAEHGHVADMVGAIESNVPPGVPVQPIDWTTGAVQALLQTEHPLGTRFLYDYHFYHHVQSPVIQKLRTEFVTQLVTRRVPFVLEVRRDFKDVMSGINTSDHFDELDRVLSQRYESVHEGNIFRLLRLKQEYATSALAVGQSKTNCSSVRC